MTDILMHCVIDLRELVERIDKDGNSGLSVEEMADWILRLERDQQTKGLRNHFREADRNNNGFVTLTEFAHTMGNVGEEDSHRKIVYALVF